MHHKKKSTQDLSGTPKDSTNLTSTIPKEIVLEGLT